MACTVNAACAETCLQLYRLHPKKQVWVGKQYCYACNKSSACNRLYSSYMLVLLVYIMQQEGCSSCELVMMVTAPAAENASGSVIVL